MIATIAWSPNLQSVVRNVFKSNPKNESDINNGISSLSPLEQEAVLINLKDHEKSGVVAQGYWI